MTERIRPSFDNPPVAEVVCGIQFDALTLMQAPHTGLFWERVRSEFPRCSSMPPLGPAVDVGTPGVMFQLDAVPPFPRLWFITATDDALIQLQQDRFLYNWKRPEPSQPYPRYPAVVQRFRALFEKFVVFTEEHALGDIGINQVEMTYVNHVPMGEGWQSFGEVGSVLPDFSWRKAERFLAQPDAFVWRTQFLLPDALSKLQVSMQSARRTDAPEKLLLRLDLTVRGVFEGNPEPNMWKWFDRANEWIVDGFIDLTSDRMQRDIWRRTK